MIAVEIAGIRIALHIDDVPLAERVRARYAAFLVPPQDAALLARVVLRADVGIAPRGDNIWRVEAEMAGDRLAYRSLHDEGWMDWKRGEGVLELRPGADIENFLRVLCAFEIVRRGGVMLHASGAVNGGRASVFFGQSGSGKSTVSHLSLDAGMTVLGDDIVIIGREADRFRAYSVPFRGSNPRSPQIAVSAPLAGLFRLVKARNHAVAAVPRAALVAQLVQCVPFVMSDPAAAARVLTTCRDLAAQTFSGELRFRMDAGFWSVIDVPASAISDPA